jgi:hypothetical protein
MVHRRAAVVARCGASPALRSREPEPSLAKMPDGRACPRRVPSA